MIAIFVCFMGNCNSCSLRIIVYFFSLILNTCKERWRTRKERSYNSWFERIKMSRVSILCYGLVHLTEFVFAGSLKDHLVIVMLLILVIEHCRFTRKWGGFPTKLWCVYNQVSKESVKISNQSQINTLVSGNTAFYCYFTRWNKWINE